MITSNTISDPDAVRYFLVQHVPDLFRRESKNIGVIVERNGELAARFFGERQDGELDGRVIRSFEYPSVYSQWVRYWRRVLKKSKLPVAEALMKPNGSHFNVLDGGAVTGSQGDSIFEVCNYVYSMLVSEGGLAEALGRSKDADDARENLRLDMSAAFKEMEILATSPSLLLPFPVQASVAVRGEKEAHVFSFVQRSKTGRTLIEPVNFITRQQMAARDHAGWTAMAFEDVKRADSTARPISVIRSSADQAGSELMAYSTRLLERVSDVVEWNDAVRKRMFLENLRETAHAA